MTAPNRPPLCDPVDRPDSYPTGPVTTTASEEDKARAALRRLIVDDTERLQFLQMLGLEGSAEPRNHRRHRKAAA